MRLSITGIVLVALLLTGCLKDSCRQTYTIYTPVYSTLTQVRAGMKSGPAQPIRNPGKLFMYGHYIFLNEVGKGIHVIDNSSPTAPRNQAFINIPGNADLAVRDHYLYADAYSDLAVFDLDRPGGVTATHFVNNVFPYRGGYYWGTTTNPDSVQVITGYEQRDTTVDCDTYQRWRGCANCAYTTADNRSYATSAPTGVGGSMARFTLTGDYLYTVSNSQLFSFSLATPAQPRLTAKTGLNNTLVETIYPFAGHLFIGSQNGMFIYNLAQPASPTYVSGFSHLRSCDPVIADDQQAYVTLRSGTACQGFTNQLEVLNITNLQQPSLLKTYPLTNPHGLAKDGNLLVVCDGAAGLKFFDASTPTDLKLFKTISGLDTYDVILQNRIALVVARDGLYQYDYTDSTTIRLLSKLPIAQ